MTGKIISSWAPTHLVEKLDRYAKQNNMSRSEAMLILMERQLLKMKVK